jgi:hypothetical protein
MTFLNFAETVGQVPLMRVYNKAGTLVDPSVASVQSAVVPFSTTTNAQPSLLIPLGQEDTNAQAQADFEAYYDNGEFTVDILDANGTNSWPMAYLTFLSMDFNGSYADCTNVQELLNFVSWIDTNDEYAVDCCPISHCSCEWFLTKPSYAYLLATGRLQQRSQRTWHHWTSACERSSSTS